MSKQQEQPLGTIRRGDDGRWVLRYERRLAHTREKVWRALTESEHLRHWMPTDIVGERRQGAPITLPFWPEVIARYGDRVDTPVLHGEIRAWDPPRLFEWTWAEDVLRWELDAAGGDTQLTFTTWIGDPDTRPAETAAGYHVCLDQLAELLERGSTTPHEDAVIARREQEYAAALAANA
jgi:uncharacterized protein YndB with AHSA1/START domain